MTNLVGNTIAQTNTDYNIAAVYKEISKNVLKYPLLDLLRSKGHLNDASVKAAKEGRGDLVKIGHTYRHDSNGADASLSIYPQMGALETGQRELRLGLIKDGLWFSRDTSMSRQRDSLGILPNQADVVERLSEFFGNLLVVGALQHLAGNTGTSISAPDLSMTAFTGAKLTNATLLNTVTAIATNYFRYGSGTANANNAAISATNSLLTYQDFQFARTIINRGFAGVDRFQTLEGGRVTALISDTGAMQLDNQAKAAGANASFSEKAYAQIAGGKEYKGLNGFFDPVLNMDFIVLPDQLMPRASHSGTENALSRSALILGKGALDFAVGAAYKGTDVPSFEIMVDDTTNKLDDQVFVQCRGIIGGKRVVKRGFAGNSANTYEAGVFAIYHSAAS